MKEKRPRYATGAYGCLKEELMNVIDELNDDGNKFVISVKMIGGFTIYSFPASYDSTMDLMMEVVNAMKNGVSVVKIGTTYVNTDHITTIRMCKHIDDRVEDDY